MALHVTFARKDTAGNYPKRQKGRAGKRIAWFDQGAAPSDQTSLRALSSPETRCSSRAGSCDPIVVCSASGIHRCA